MKPYYEHGGITIYHGDCRDVLPSLQSDVLVTDPPYPNNAGLFNEAVMTSRMILRAWNGIEAIVFWTELEQPSVLMPLVAVHIWHRTNVNGRPYEPAYHYAADGRKRRSEIIQAAAVFDGVGPGCSEYLGHPTQKNEGVMRWLIKKTAGSHRAIVDPFMGVGTTLRAAKNCGRSAIGIEIEERYCEIAAKRLAQEVLPLEQGA